MSLSKSMVANCEGALGWAREHPRLAAGVLASTLAVAYNCVKSALSSPRLPPGPPAWPVVGSMFSLSGKMHLDIERLRRHYGDVFTLWLGRKPLVVLASHDAIKEAFLSRGNDFAGRPTQGFILNQEVFQDEMFIAEFSEKWSRDKKYALSCLRTLGGIKAGADGSIVEEIAVLINKLRDLNQTPVDISDVTLNTTTNIIYGMLFNERMDHDDPKLKELRDLVTDFNTILSEHSVIESLLPQILARLCGGNKTNRLKETIEKLDNFIAEQVAEHRISFDAANPRDFVDMYLIKPDLEIGKPFYDTIIAFASDAIHSMATFMRWIVLYLGHHPEIQKQIQAEIDEAVGPSQMITIAERPKLRYTEAVLLEVMRISDSSIRTAFHVPVADGITFRGYDIPRYCQMTGAIYSVHKDPTLFPEPENFDPQRFLDERGDIVKANLVIPFGVGRRMCLGESLAKLELFLFLANVLHMFSITFPPDQPQPSLEPAGGLIQLPHPYTAIFVPRE